MSITLHHAIIVTDFDSDRLEKHHAYAKAIGLYTTDLGPVTNNGWQSFLVCPDGSGEGWPTSDTFDRIRQRFTRYLRENDAHFVEVRFGGDYSNLAAILERS